MRKILYGSLLVVMVLFAVPFRATVAAAPYAAVSPTVSAMPKITPTPTPEHVTYFLPYPGILPTHPLYMFKALRDRIIEMLITDKVRKAEFYILQADKKLNMAIFLSSAGQSAPAKQAFADAVVLREKAVSILEQLKSSGSDAPRYVVEKLVMSLGKHIEVLNSYYFDTTAVQGLVSRAKAILTPHL
jgi:hypothetical protein